MIQIDIDMPINCATCPFTRAINTYSFDSMCVLTKKKANEIRHREEWCPLREVVRCKDCKYWHNNTEFCDLWSVPNVAQHTYANGYCFRAERREP